jgi:hypothetical protein
VTPYTPCICAKKEPAPWTTPPPTGQTHGLMDGLRYGRLPTSQRGPLLNDFNSSRQTPLREKDPLKGGDQLIALFSRSLF